MWLESDRSDIAEVVGAERNSSHTAAAFSAFLLRTGIFGLLLLFHPPLDRAELLSARSYLVVPQMDRSDCSKATGTLRYRPHTVTAVCEFFRFLVLCFISVVLLFGWLLSTICALIWDSLVTIILIIVEPWLTGLCPWFLFLTLRRFSTLKFLCLLEVCFVLLPLFAIAPHKFLQVGEIVIRCLLLLLRYYCYCVEFLIIVHIC